MIRRAAKALALVVAGILAIPLIQGAVGASGAGSEKPSVLAVLPSSQEDALERIEEKSGKGTIDGSSEEAHEQLATFEQEAFSLEDAMDLRVGAEGCVIGFSQKGTGRSVFEDVCAKLQRNGWTKVPSGQDACGSFAKEAGSLRWLYVSCTEVSDQVSVVIQLAGD